MNFKTDNDKMIQTIDDALAVIELGVSDVLNEVFVQSLRVFFGAYLHQTSSLRCMLTKAISLSVRIPEWWVWSIWQRKKCCG